MKITVCCLIWSSCHTQTEPYCRRVLQPDLLCFYVCTVHGLQQMIHNTIAESYKTDKQDAHTHVNMHTYTETYLDGKKEAKRTLGNNNPTHFLSFLAVNCSWLDCMHAHVQYMKSLLCVCVWDKCWKVLILIIFDPKMAAFLLVYVSFFLNVFKKFPATSSVAGSHCHVEWI